MVGAALIAWFPVTAGLFLVLRPHLAAATSMILGVALLPALREISVPVLPDLTQYTVPVIASTIMAVALHNRRLVAAAPGTGPEILIGFMIFGALLTNVTNMDPLVFGPNIISAMSPTDTVNDAFQYLADWALPFFLGRAFVRSTKEAVEVLGVLALAGLFYVPFVLVELQTGPLWHTIIYGATPSPRTFWHSLKYGGFRPNVLMNHGLTLSSFMCFCTFAWCGLTRVKNKPFKLPIPVGPTTALMTIVVIFCKSRAVWLYTLFTVPTLLFARARTAIAIAAVLAGVILSYPFLRSLDLIPVQEMLDISAEYAGYDAMKSLEQRLETEDEILGRAAERYFFGWGGYSRYWTYDPMTGEPLSTMDGMWLVIFGQGGLTRFMCLFGFLLFPIFYAWRKAGAIRSKPALIVMATLSWICVLRVFDMLPNSTMDPYGQFLGGALYGTAQFEAIRARSPRRSAPRPDSARKRASPPAPSGDSPGGGERPSSLAAGLRVGPDPTR